jgi:hypothetical protein
MIRALTRMRLVGTGPDNVAMPSTIASRFIETGDAEWDRIRALLAAAGMGFDYTMEIAGRARLAYVDARASLGHYLEICQLEPDDIAFFNSLVAGSA